VIIFTVNRVNQHQNNYKENIMAVPKRKSTHSRSAKRRTHYKITLKAPVKMEDGTWKMPHFVNPTTGEYKS
jgi:large subunit ribosomal protein L32